MIIPGDGFSAELVRSRKRKTLGINIRRGEVQVRAPHNLAMAEILDFVHHKTAWIQRVLDRHQQMPAAPLKTFAEGETFLFLGRPLALSVRSGGAACVDRRQAELVLTLAAGFDNPAKREQLLAQWYREQARAHLSTRCDHFAAGMGVRYRNLKIRLYRSRWGGCSHRGELQFNWLLMMARPEVIDYVVVHELCHLRYFNHSPQFWRAVAEVMPDYREHRDWLRHQNCLIWT